jgi:hypothetical protein
MVWISVPLEVHVIMLMKLANEVFGSW